MKKIVVVLLILAGAAVGVWFASHRRAGMEMDPAEGEPGHKHVLVKKTDEAGKVYWTCTMHPQVHSGKPGNCPICGMQLIKKTESPAADTDAASDGERKPLYWYDPMKPDQHFDKPGKSPFMDMQLVPMYSHAAVGGNQGIISIDARMAQNLGIRTVLVERGTIAQEVRAAGGVTADETRIEVVQARAAGWVEKLHVRSVNDPVTKGQLLAEIYAPDLLAAQQEFLLSLRSGREHPGADTLVQASRERLSFLGLSDRQIARIEKTGQAQHRVAIYSPINGVITELGVREGVQVMPGMNLFNLVGLSQVWVTAQITESQAGWVTKGQAAEVSLPALPGRTFKGHVDYVYPDVMAETRTLKVRIRLDNPKLELKPGMFASVVIGAGATRDALLVPSEALIKTGTRSVVIVAESEGRFRPVDVTVGTESQGKLEIREGLQEGQQVVASGQFLIDSEANLRGALTRMTSAEGAPAADGKKMDDMKMDTGKAR